MHITLNDQKYVFQLWKPNMGQVFNKTFAFDCETTLIDEQRPWITPAYVIGAACDGRRGYFIRREDVRAFFQVHADTAVTFHNAAFDLAVINKLVPDLSIYDRVERELIWDSQLLHRLYVLGTAGDTAGKKGGSSLEHCAETYLNCELPKDVTDADGKIVRLSYSKWLNRPFNEIEQIYLEYLAKDAVVTYRVYRKLRNRIKRLMADSRDAWGFVDDAWLVEQVSKWGPQTHHIQLKASIVLKQISDNGLRLDVARRDELAEGLQAKIDSLRKFLRKFGYLAGGEGSDKSLQAVFKQMEFKYKESHFPRTETGEYCTAYEPLQDLAAEVPFIRLYLEYKDTEKLLNTFVGKMSKRVLHPSFNVLARSGRTSSFGEINAQNLPKDDRVRSCFVPSSDHILIDADYKTIELATLGESCIAQFGLESQMAVAINEGKDLHALVAAKVQGKPESEVTKEERSKAKPINFGKPGGMGNKAMQQYAKTSYGVSLTDAEVEAFSTAWLDLFPEMNQFLQDHVDTPLELAKLLDLSPASHHEHTDETRFVGHPANAGKEHEPNSILGCMCIKILRTANPKKNDGEPYLQSDLDFFWSKLAAKASAFGAKFQKAIINRQPSARLQRHVMSVAGAAACFTLTGRLRAKATFSARHNTVFQGLAADGAKLALWNLWRGGYRIVNFIHDQVLIEVPADSDLLRHAKKIRRLMIAGMQAVIPNMKVEVSYAASERWYKDAEAVFDKSKKQLLLWQPKPEYVPQPNTV